MDRLPSGTVTFLFTDIEDSTRLWQEQPEAMSHAHALHDEILQEAIEAHHGYVFQIVGDSFSVAFHNAQDALLAALTAQRELQTRQKDPALQIKARMGLHTGSAELQPDGKYEGYVTIASTQRVMSVAHGGQVLLSHTTADLLNGPPEGVSLRDIGEHQLKSLRSSLRLYQLIAPGLPQDFPPIQSLNQFPNNLPTQLTSFIGREKEIAEIKAAPDSARLVTLTGSGGTGKRRLSQEVGTQLLTNFQHGVWLVELAPLSDESQIIPALAQVFGLQELPFNPAVAQICHRLDGIPLAIELAAARTKLLSAEPIAARLDDMFRLLVGGSRTALPRQQTLRALIDWSYDLLADEEKHLLQFASVFVGGWTLDALEFVADDPNTLELLEQLINKSLVMTEERGGEMRYFMLETICQYWREKLFEAKQAAVACDRHFIHFRNSSSGLWDVSRLSSEFEIQRLKSKQEEIENLRAAFEWGLQNHVQDALELASNMAMSISMMERQLEGITILREVMEKFRVLPPVEGEENRVREEIYVHGCFSVGNLLQGTNEIMLSRSVLQEAVAIARELGNKYLLGMCLGMYANASNMIQAQALGNPKGDSLDDNIFKLPSSKRFPETCRENFRIAFGNTGINWHD